MEILSNIFRGRDAPVTDRTAVDRDEGGHLYYEHDVTPQMFKDELNAGNGAITVWINSLGGDCVAAAQISIGDLHLLTIGMVNNMYKEKTRKL